MKEQLLHRRFPGVVAVLHHPLQVQLPVVGDVAQVQPADPTRPEHAHVEPPESAAAPAAGMSGRRGGGWGGGEGAERC